MAAGIKTLWSLSFSSLLSNVLLILLVLWVPAATEPSLEQFSLDQSLENALVCSPFSRYVLAETFFPKVGEQPICIPVKYTIFDCSNQTCSASTCCNCTSALVYNATFLWTQYNIDNVIGPLLLSFAWSGVVVRGFDWGYNCLVRGGIDLVLRVGQLDWNQSEPLMEDALRGVTAVLKGYASKAVQFRPLVDSSDTQGFAIGWSNADQKSRVFEKSKIILTSMVAILDLFIFLLAIGMTAYSYDKVYNKVKGKKNPGYPLFWSTAVLCACWDVAPSWLVLAYYNNQVKVSLIVLTPLLLLVAVLFKKKSDFPVPCFRVCAKHKGVYAYSIDKKVWQCFRCLMSHVVQIVAMWAILLFFVFLIYYIPPVIITFYLYPAGTLIKIVFLKAVAICAVLTVALIFSLGGFRFRPSCRDLKHDVKTGVYVLNVVIFLPILAFLAFVICGILFVQKQNTSVTGLQAIITTIPSVFLAVVAWLSRGRLFPAGVKDADDPASEVISDVEGGEPPRHVERVDASSPAVNHSVAASFDTLGSGDVGEMSPTGRLVSPHKTTVTLHSRSTSSSPRFERMSNYSSIGSRVSSSSPVATRGYRSREDDPTKPLLQT